MKLKTIVELLWKIPLLGIAYVLGNMISAPLLNTLHLSLPSIPSQVDPKIIGQILLIGSLFLAGISVAVARKIRGNKLQRGLLLFLLIYLCLGVNVPIETALFLKNSNPYPMFLFFSIPCLFLAFLAAVLVRQTPESDQRFQGSAILQYFSKKELLWRIGLIILSFPLIYYIMGISISPWIMDFYKREVMGLVIPSQGTLLSLQILRSSFFFLAIFPLYYNWTGTKLQFLISLALAQYVLVGFFPMMQVYWFPKTLIIVHNLEILTDSLLYLTVFTFLLSPHAKTLKTSISRQTTVV